MSATLDSLCASCRSPKANLTCELCDEPVCRSCVQYLAADRLSFLPEKAAELTFSRYCQGCYIQHVEPAIAAYDEGLEKAKQVNYLSKTYRGQIPILKKALKKVEVSGCSDREEVMLKLAFLANLQGFNALIEAEVDSAKVRNEGWQTMTWQGKALPADVDEERLARRDPHHAFNGGRRTR